jgi:hypothetical protein
MAVAIAIAAVLRASPARADARVVRCSADDEPTAQMDLGKAVAIGGRITFACPAGTVIKMTRRHIVSRNTRIDGGGTITLDGQGKTALFDVSNPSVVLELSGLIIRNARPSGFAKGGVVSGRATVQLTRAEIGNSRDAFTLVEGRVRAVDSRLVDGTGTAITAPNVELLRTHIRSGSGQPLVSAGGVVEIRDSSISGGGSSSFSACRLSIVGSTFAWSSATAVVTGCETSIRDSHFNDNHGVRGGALRLDGSAPALTIRGGGFFRNRADSVGGAIVTEAASGQRTITLRTVRFEGNQAEFGGGVYLRGAFPWSAETLDGRGVIFAENHAAKIGGAIDAINVSIQLARAVFAKNGAGESGGAMQAFAFPISSFIVANAVFVGNDAPSGSVFHGAFARFINNTVIANTGGPAIVVTQRIGPDWIRSIRLRNTVLVGNTPSACDSATAFLVVDDGNNLQFPAAGCASTIPVADPGLDSLFIPAWGGPADGTGDLRTCLARPVNGADIYGRHRPQGKSCAIGAAEGSIEDVVLQRHPRFGDLPRTPPGSPCPCDTERPSSAKSAEASNRPPVKPRTPAQSKLPRGSRMKRTLDTGPSSGPTSVR